MTNNLMVNVSECFDMEKMINDLVECYEAKGFQIRVVKLKNGHKITFEKDCGGINTILGMGIGLSATCTLIGKEHDTLNVCFGEEEWTGKIIACAIGLCLCFIPIITGIIGVMKQLSFPKELGNDIERIAREQ